MDEANWFRELLHAVSEGVVGLGADGRVTFLNPAAERQLKRRATDAVGLPAGDVLGEASVARRRDLTGADGRPAGALLILGLPEMGDDGAFHLVAAGVGHQINNLLQTILGNAELLAAQLPPGATGNWRKAVDAIVLRSDEAAGVIRRMMGAARRRPDQAACHDLAQVVNQVAGWLDGIVPPEVRLVTEPGPAPSQAWVDPEHLRVVLQNLARNAIAAMPDGGELRVAVETSPGGTPQHRALVVSDTGVGMPREILDRVFQPFFTTRRESGHAGMGLCVVYELVHRCGGSIEVSSTPGHGTTFRLHLPTSSPWNATEPATEDARATGATPPPLEDLRGTETVLVAEDSDAIRMLVSDELAHLGYTVLQASRGDEALEVATRHDGRVHLLISDVMMPGMGGLDLARALRERMPALGIIFLSGYVTLAVNERLGRELGALFVAKPFAFGELARKARQLLDAR